MRRDVSRLRGRLAAGVVCAAAGIAAACTDQHPNVLAPQAVQYGFALIPDGRNLPGGGVAYQRPTASANAGEVDTAVVVTLRGLDSLPQKVYQVWLADPTADQSALTGVVKATGTLRIVRTDTTVDQNGDVVATENVRTVTDVSSFSNGGPATRMVLTVTRASLGGALTPYTRKLVVVTIEDNASATAPGPLRPMWARVADTSAAAGFNRPGTPVTIGLVSTAPARFGTFAVKTAEEYQYRVVGRGRGAVGDRFIVFDDSALMRPPLGYYYAGYAVKLDDKNKAVDTLDLGPQTAPFPRRTTSLRDADATEPDPVVQKTPPSIVAAASKVSVDTVARFSTMDKPFAGFAFAYVTLESKYGREGVAAPTIVLSGTIPGVVRNPK